MNPISDVTEALRPGRNRRQFRAVDDPHVARLQLLRDARLLRPRQQRLVQLPVHRGVTLQDAVVDAAAVQRQRVGLLTVERLRHPPLEVDGARVLTPDRLDDPAGLLVQPLRSPARGFASP